MLEVATAGRDALLVAATSSASRPRPATSSISS
jgi:hypothetical protein